MLCADAGLKREDVWVSNASMCKARKIKLANGAIIPKLQVKAAATMACRRRLINELITVDPVVIVPLGNWALWSVLDIAKAKIYSYRGSISDVDLRVLAKKLIDGTMSSPMRQVKGV